MALLVRSFVAALVLASAACRSSPDLAPRLEHGEAPAASTPDDPGALSMTATIYDDGLACPGECDAHVVFAKTLNGAGNAFAPPASSRLTPQTCRRGDRCVICFGVKGDTCMEAVYRGGGPPKGRFDFTPAFYEANCGEADLPAALAAECGRLQTAISAGGYDRRLNCLAQPEADRCRALTAAAEGKRARDAVERERCLALGEPAYNAQQRDESLHRTLGCNYYLNQKGSNARGQIWFKLAPGACRPRTYVGRDGLDCCSSNLFAAAAFHPECRKYFLDR